MALGEQFYVNNPSSGLLQIVLAQLTDPTIFRMTFASQTYSQGGSYASDGSVTEQANILAGLPTQLFASGHAQAAAAMVDQSFWIAPFACQVTAIAEIHAVAEATAASLFLQITKDTSTNAPGAGTDLLTNNTNNGFDCKATANTLQNGILTATVASLQLATGDRLSMDFTAAATELVGLTVIVTLSRL